MRAVQFQWSSSLSCLDYLGPFDGRLMLWILEWRKRLTSLGVSLMISRLFGWIWRHVFTACTDYNINKSRQCTQLLHCCKCRQEWPQADYIDDIFTSSGSVWGFHGLQPREANEYELIILIKWSIMNFYYLQFRPDWHQAMLLIKLQREAAHNWRRWSENW